MAEAASLKSLMDAIEKTATAKQELTDAETALETITQQDNSADTTAEAAKIKDCTDELEKNIEEEKQLRKIARDYLTDEAGTTNDPDNKNKDAVETTSTATGTRRAVTKMAFSFRVPKPEKYERGKNFQKFCTKFTDYVTLSSITDDNLYILFLSLVDEFTNDKLRKVSLSPEQKKDATEFTKEFIKKMTPSHEGRTFRSKLADLRQESSENVEDFAFRISDTASRAFQETSEELLLKEEACLSSFLKGLYDPDLRLKMHESRAIGSFEDAVEEASRLESIRATAGPMKNEEPPSGNMEVLKIHDSALQKQSPEQGLKGQNRYSNSRDDDRTDRQQDRRYDHSRDRRPEYRTDRQQDRGYDHSRDRRPEYRTDRQQDRRYDHSRDRQPEYRTDRQHDRQGNGGNRSPEYQDRANSRREGNKGPIICWRCNQPNHIARRCTTDLN
jgi:hypothetical protein